MTPAIQGLDQSIDCWAHPRFLDAVSPQSPFRRPDWRWRVARRHVEHNRRLWPPWNDDPWTVRAFNYVRCRKLPGLELAPDCTASFGAISQARRLRSARHKVFRIELEARLLTGESCAQVAERCGLEPDIVEAYEHLFYDVRAKLKHRSFVLRQLVGPKLYTGFGPTDLDVLWKLVAFQGGNLALDAIMDFGWPMERPERLDDIASYFAQCAEATTARQFFIGALTLQPGDLDAKALGRLLRTLDQSEATGRADQVPGGLIRAAASSAGAGSSAVGNDVSIARRLQQLAAEQVPAKPVGETPSTSPSRDDQPAAASLQPVDAVDQTPRSMTQVA